MTQTTEMPDSLEGTIQRLAAELIDINPGTHPENVAEKLREFAHKILMIAGVKLI